MSWIVIVAASQRFFPAPFLCFLLALLALPFSGLLTPSLCTVPLTAATCSSHTLSTLYEAGTRRCPLAFFLLRLFMRFLTHCTPCSALQSSTL